MASSTVVSSFLTVLPEEQDGSLKETGLRILVVDDFLPIRRVVCGELRSIPDLQAIIEAADGQEAVQLATELQPDLVVMDITLPKLNGIEAARHIHKLSPHSKILFLSQEASLEIIREALATGAKGYVVKMHIIGSLMTAVKAVLRGETAVVAK